MTLTGRTNLPPTRAEPTGSGPLGVSFGRPWCLLSNCQDLWIKIIRQLQAGPPPQVVR